MRTDKDWRRRSREGVIRGNRRGQADGKVTAGTLGLGEAETAKQHCSEQIPQQQLELHWQSGGKTSLRGILEVIRAIEL